MKTWKRNAVAATVLMFLCAAVYLNWSYGKDEDVPVLTDTIDSQKVLGETELVINDDIVINGDEDYLLQTAEETAAQDSEDYFATIRLARQQTRDSAAELLQEAAAYTEDPLTDEVSDAAAQLEEVVKTALTEAQIEGLVISRGYGDCVAFCSDGSISLAVASPQEGLTQEDVATLTDIVKSETDYSVSQLKIIEVGK